MSRTLKNGQLYIQEDHYMFISPTPLIPLPSVSFQILSLRASQGRSNLLTR